MWIQILFVYLYSNQLKLKVMDTPTLLMHVRGIFIFIIAVLIVRFICLQVKKGIIKIVKGK